MNFDRKYEKAHDFLVREELLDIQADIVCQPGVVNDLLTIYADSDTSHDEHFKQMKHVANFHPHVDRPTWNELLIEWHNCLFQEYHH